MKFTSQVLVAFFISAFTTFAAAKEATTLVVKQSEAAFGQSELNRQEKEYSLTGEAGLLVGAIPGAGVNAGVFLDSDSLVQASYSAGSITILDFEGRAKVAGLHYKRFFANSFYARAGSSYRQIKMQEDGWFSNTRKEVGSSEYVVADIAIGNQWQWSQFTMGCDWAGVMIPLAKLTSSYDTTGMTEAERKDAEETWDRFGKSTTYQFLRFYLGASF